MQEQSAGRPGRRHRADRHRGHGRARKETDPALAGERPRTYLIFRAQTARAADLAASGVALMGKTKENHQTYLTRAANPWALRQTPLVGNEKQNWSEMPHSRKGS